MDPSETAQDPLAALGADIFARVLAALPAQDLLQCHLVCASWNSLLLERDGELWAPAAEAAWAEAVYVAVRPDLPTWRRRFVAEQLWERKRCAITDAELTTFTWTFRFKRQAGLEWQALDPFWGRGERCRRWFCALDAGTGALAGRPGAAGVMAAPRDDPFNFDADEAAALPDGRVAQYRWRLLAEPDPGVPARARAGRARAGQRFLQVENFPRLWFGRTPGGGWRAENMWVVFEAALHKGGPYARGIGAGAAPHLE